MTRLMTSQRPLSGTRCPWWQRMINPDPHSDLAFTADELQLLRVIAPLFVLGVVTALTIPVAAWGLVQRWRGRP